VFALKELSISSRARGEFSMNAAATAASHTRILPVKKEFCDGDDDGNGIK
jgi:hypothetical protein